MVAVTCRRHAVTQSIKLVAISITSSPTTIAPYLKREIEDATKNFEKVLGQGGEAIVYIGQISAIGLVAVKCLKSNVIEFEEEIEIVSKIKHPHLVSLHGYCHESGQKILVYEYMGKGSLSEYIKKNSRSTICLSWQQRLNICLGAARGLLHLHTETEELPKGIIHRDIKPDNILLDDNWVAKVSDFGMCKLSHAGQEKSTMITLLKGTGGYYAPEYVKFRSITRKIDVYAFGVVLFEVLCRKMPWDRGDESYYGSEDEDLGLWARENVDPEIYEEISEDSLDVYTHIIGRSLQQDPSTRPTMDDVVMDLECALKCTEHQDERLLPKASTSGRKVSVPSSVLRKIQDIKELTGNSEAEIYEMLKECSMDPFQTIQKLFKKVRKTNDTTDELPESSNTTLLQNDEGITIEDQVLDPTKALEYPVGILRVKVLKAMQLKKNLLGSPDPYVKIKFTEGKHLPKKTTVMYKNLNPEWNEEFHMVVKDPEFQAVEFTVYDWERIGKHEKMGMNVLPLKELTPDEPKVITLELLKNMDLNDAQNEKSRGQLLVELIYKPFKEEDLLSFADSSTNAPEGTPAGGGLLVVVIHKAQDVQGKRHTNPAARIIFKGEEKKTKHVKSGDPRWDEEFAFILEEPPIDERMHVEVFSTSPKTSFLRSKDETLGYVNINLSAVVHKEKTIEKYDLIGSRNGRIQVELQWRTP